MKADGTKRDASRQLGMPLVRKKQERKRIWGLGEKKTERCVALLLQAICRSWRTEAEQSKMLKKSLKLGLPCTCRQ